MSNSQDRASISKNNTELKEPDVLNPACRVAGIRMIPVVNGKFKVWTKKIGSGKTKVLLLHGGPGFNHEYLECFEDFLPPSGFEMYYYDQLGCCNSDLAGEEASNNMSLWTLPRYLDEVEEVRRGLALENFVIVGHVSDVPVNPLPWYCIALSHLIIS